MVCEVLYPEHCIYYDDSANVRYLKACAPQMDFVYTSNNDVPYFSQHKVDIIYMGSMSEKSQLKIKDNLLPYKDSLTKAIENGTIILFTGNAVELLGKCIEDKDKEIPMLWLYDFKAVRDFDNRHNSMFLGSFMNKKIVGFKSQFSFLQGNFPGNFISVSGGVGNSKGDNNEGFRENNLFATYLLGPLLIINPYFTKYILNLLGLPDELAYEKEVIEAYDYRVKQLSMDGAAFTVKY